MKDEIKEIIYLEKYVDKYKSDEKSIINGNRLTTPAMLDYLEVKALLDYITNLQEKYERMKENAEILSNGCNELEQKIDKAIEYINEHYYEQINYGEYVVNANHLLEILKGSDEQC